MADGMVWVVESQCGRKGCSCGNPWEPSTLSTVRSDAREQLKEIRAKYKPLPTVPPSKFRISKYTRVSA